MKAVSLNYFFSIKTSWIEFTRMKGFGLGMGASIKLIKRIDIGFERMCTRAVSTSISNMWLSQFFL